MSDARALYKEAFGHFVKGNLDEAAAGRRLVELEPDEALGHTSLSIFYQRKGMIREAEDEKAIATRLAMRAPA